MSDRVLSIDIARGLGILLIVLGHNPLVGAHSALYHIVYSFHVPLFFFLSGLFFRPQNSFIRTCVGKANALLKPYFVTSFFVFILYVFHKGGASLPFIAGVCYGTGDTLAWEPLWFLPHLWLIYVFAWCVARVSRYETRLNYQKALILVFLLVGGYFVMPLFWHKPITGCLESVLSLSLLPGLPFSLDLVLMSSFYFLLGFTLKKEVLNPRFHPVPVFVALISFSSILYVWGSSMDLNERQYDHLILSTLVAVSGILLVLAVSKLLEKLPVVKTGMAYIGSGSLFILLFHGYLQGRSFMSLNAYLKSGVLLNATLAFLVSVVGSLLIMEMVRYAKHLLSKWSCLIK